MDSGGDPNLLIIIIDVNRVWWGEKSLNQENSDQNISLTELVDSIIAFANAHLLISSRNKLAIIATHANKSQYIYPLPEHSQAIENSVGATADTLQLLKMSVKGELSHLLSEVDDRELHADSVIAGALCMALCYIHKQEQALLVGEMLASRIVVIKGTEDNSEQYMNFMNAVFTAQKKNVVIDACLFENSSGLLQQWAFLPDANSRSKMSMPPRSQVDYRAACFCHRQLIDRGYVCSVCLSIFCDFQAICSTCRVPFKILGGPVIRKKLKKIT